MTPREQAIEAYKMILAAKEHLRHFADFRYMFSTPEDDHREKAGTAEG